jgi:D-serine deaminase-like pyridoxal phosphate-dependent protein
MAYRGMKTAFKNSLYVLATVISAGPNHFVIDAGVKSICPDQGNPGLDGIEFESVSLSEEHTAFYGPHSLKVGDMVKVVPGHCCSTVNLYDEMYLLDGDTVIDRIPVVGRGKAR